MGKGQGKRRGMSPKEGEFRFTPCLLIYKYNEWDLIKRKIKGRYRCHMDERHLV